MNIPRGDDSVSDSTALLGLLYSIGLLSIRLLRSASRPLPGSHRIPLLLRQLSSSTRASQAEERRSQTAVRRGQGPVPSGSEESPHTERHTPHTI